jgi:hypothetical protein
MKTVASVLFFSAIVLPTTPVFAQSHSLDRSFCPRGSGITAERFCNYYYSEALDRLETASVLCFPPGRSIHDAINGNFDVACPWFTQELGQYQRQIVACLNSYDGHCQ